MRSGGSQLRSRLAVQRDRAVGGRDDPQAVRFARVWPGSGVLMTPPFPSHRYQRLRRVTRGNRIRPRSGRLSTPVIKLSGGCNVARYGRRTVRG